MTRTRTFAAALVLALPLAALAQGRPDPQRGLLAWYPFDGNAVDQVTRTQGRVSGTRPIEGHDGRPQGALWFDGARAWVALGDSLQPQRFTISAWIRPDVNDRVMAIVSKIRNLPGHYERNFELRLEPGGRLLLHVPSGRGWEAAQGERPIPPGRWTHVAATYDGARAQLWVDGVRDGAPLDVAYAQTRTETGIGARPEGGGRDGRTPSGPTFFFAGAIEDVRIWDRALAEPELLLASGRAPTSPPPPAYPPPGRGPPPGRPGPQAGAELLAWYPLDGDVRDAAGGAEGRPSAKPRFAEDRAGNPQGALALAGKDFLSLGARQEPEQLTLAAWVRPNRVDREMAIVSKWSSAPGPRDRWLELRIDPGGRVALTLPGGERGSRVQLVRSARAVAPGRWAHVAATYDGDRAVVYVDGVPDAEATLEPFEPSRAPVFVGARPDPSGTRAKLGTGFDGRLDDVRVFRGALSEPEVASLVRERPRRPGPGPGAGGEEDDQDLLLAKVDRMLARWDVAVARRNLDALGALESRFVGELEGAERQARSDRDTRLAGDLRRAISELQAARGRTDAMSLDRKRSAMAALGEALWNDLAQDLDGNATPPPPPGGGIRRDDPWR